MIQRYIQHQNRHTSVEKFIEPIRKITITTFASENFERKKNKKK